MLKNILNLVKKYYLYSFFLLLIIFITRLFSKKKVLNNTLNEITFNIQDSTLIDPRDNQTYRIRRFDNIWWMIDNLNFNMGDSLFYENTYIGLGSYCYKNNLDFGKKYGRLYDLAAAVNSCPKGWRLPSKKDWKNLNKKYANCQSEKNSPSGNIRITPPLFEPTGGGKGSIRKLNLEEYKAKGSKALSSFIGLEKEGYYWCKDDLDKPRFFKINITNCEASVTHYQGASTKESLAQGVFLSCRCVKEK